MDSIWSSNLLRRLSVHQICIWMGCWQIRHGQVLGSGRVETRRLGKHKGRAHKLSVEPASPHRFLSCGEDGVVNQVRYQLLSCTTHNCKSPHSSFLVTWGLKIPIFFTSHRNISTRSLQFYFAVAQIHGLPVICMFGACPDALLMPVLVSNWTSRVTLKGYWENRTSLVNYPALLYSLLITNVLQEAWQCWRDEGVVDPISWWDVDHFRAFT
jgi:hypothetical protein